MKWKKRFFEGLKYVSKTRNYSYFAFAVFLFSSILGFVFSDKLGNLDYLLRDLILKTESMNSIELVFFIFQNNLYVSFITLITGIFFGLLPFFGAVTNGVLVGYVLNKLYLVSGFQEFWRILPHGIFELPAVFISMGIGIRLGMFIFYKREKLKDSFYQSLNAFLFIVIPLLIIAAIIEGLLIGIFR